jgi:hypothetical protein
LVAFNPQVLTDSFVVTSELVSVGMGDTELVLVNDPNRVCSIISCPSADVTFNINPPSSGDDGFRLTSANAPFVLIYRDHGAMVGYAWHCYNGGMFQAEVSIISSIFRPER